MKELKINPPKIKNKVLISNDRYSNYRNINTSFGEKKEELKYSEKILEIMDTIQYDENEMTLTFTAGSKNIEMICLYINDKLFKKVEPTFIDDDVKVYCFTKIIIDVNELFEISESAELNLYLKDCFTPFRSADYQIDFS